MAWRAVRVVVGLPLAVLLVLSCAGAPVTFESRAYGAWTCQPPASATDAHAYVLVIQSDHQFVVEQPPLPGQKAGIGLAGTWSLDDGEVDILWGVKGPPNLFVTGVAQDATRLSVSKQTTPPSDLGVIVARRGYETVTVKADQPGSITWTCRKG